MVVEQVIPQLIARIDTPRTLVSRLIHHLLMDIGKHHPQALVYPLTVASKSASLPRRNAANKILKNMCEHSASLVQQAVMVSMPILFVHKYQCQILIFLRVESRTILIQI